MPSRYITKPQAVSVDGKPYGIAHFVFTMVEHDQRFSQDAEGVRSRARIEVAFVKHQADSFVELDEKDWKRLHEACERPSAKQYPVSPATLCLWFIEAIKAASLTPPAVVAVPDKPAKPAKASKKKGAPTA